MSGARAEIFNRIRSSLGRERIDNDRLSELEQRIAAPPTHLQPHFEADPVTRFADKLALGGGTFERVAGESEAFEAIAGHLQEKGVDPKIVAAPALREHAWPADWEVKFGATRGDDLVAVTPCFAAVAETGSVVLLSSPDSPTSLNFLPDYHIVLVSAEQLVRYIEDVWTLLRQAGPVPRTVNFITGPSKTADVEQTLQLGAHGPRSLHVILIGG